MSTLRAPRYLQQFRCLAQDCPDTCCAGFVVRLSKEDVARVASAVGDEPAQVAALERTVTQEARDDGAVATLRQGEACGFLTQGKLCSLVIKRGDAALPDACALYPRSLSYFADRTEVHATAACPEAARLMLSSDDALELVEVGEEIAARIDPAPGAGKRTPYTARREEVLGIAETILRREDRLPRKLALLAELAGQVTPFFHEGAGHADQDRWDDAIAWLGSPEAEAHARTFLSEGLPGDSVAAQIVFGVLTHLREQAPPRFIALSDAAMGTYQRQLPADFSGNVFEALARRVAESAAAVDKVWGAELDRMLTRHVRNEWRRAWFTGSRSLAAYLFKQLVELAVIRTCAIARLLERSANDDPRPVMAETVQIVSRRLSSSGALMDALETNLSAESIGESEAGRLRLLLRYAWPP